MVFVLAAISESSSKLIHKGNRIAGSFDDVKPRAVHQRPGEVQNGRYHHCPNSGHAAQFDDAETYFEGLIRFIKDVDAGQF